MKTRCAFASLSLLFWLGTLASASTSYGTISNFDAVNDTGQVCHGFEIELDDIHSTNITYTYDYNHYGTPAIREDNSDPAHPKVFVRYQSARDSAGNYLAFTAVPPAPIPATQGHQCTNPSVNFGCEHFGVGYSAPPSLAKFNWLVDDGAGNLILGPAVNVAMPSWTYYPPVGAQPAQVQAVIPAPPPPPEIVKEFGDAVWVKSIVTTSHSNNRVELRDLVSDDPDDPNDKNWRNGEPDEVEVEWAILQEEFNNPGGANNELAGGAEGLPHGDEVVTRRYEFYKYSGPYDEETNEALCDRYPDPMPAPECAVQLLGDYIGAQMAGFNVVAPLGLIDHLQEGQVGELYPDRTVVVGGNSPYISTIALGALPDGLSLDVVTGVLSGTPTAEGTFSVTIDAIDGDGITVSKAYELLVREAAVADTTPPVTTANIVGPAGSNGWYRGGVTVTLVATDVDGPADVAGTSYGVDGGALLPYTAPFAVSGDGVHAIQFQSVDRAGNLEPILSQTISIDQTAPNMIALHSPDPNANGWNNTPVTITFQCSDVLSGLAAGSPPAPTIVSTQGAGQSVPGTCTDLAGNAVSLTAMDIDIDTTAPSLSAPANQDVKQTSAAGAIANYQAPTIVDTGSGIASSDCVPASGSVFPVGLTTVGCTATDLAGNTGTAHFNVTVHEMTPLERADVNSDGVVDAKDLVLVRAATGKRTGQAGFDARFDFDGNGQITVADLNFVTRFIGRRAVPPVTITGTVWPAPDATGWNNTNVTIYFACTNATSCQAPIFVSTEGDNQTFTGTAVGPGGTVTTQVTVNLDKSR